MALVPFEAPDTAALETPTKSKQKSLFEFWSTEKETKPSSEGCELQAGSHVKLRKGLSAEEILAFERSLKRVRDNETLALPSIKLPSLDMAVVDSSTSGVKATEHVFTIEHCVVIGATESGIKLLDTENLKDYDIEWPERRETVDLSKSKGCSYRAVVRELSEGDQLFLECGKYKLQAIEEKAKLHERFINAVIDHAQCQGQNVK